MMPGNGFPSKKKLSPEVFSNLDENVGYPAVNLSHKKAGQVASDSLGLRLQIKVPFAVSRLWLRPNLCVCPVNCLPFTDYSMGCFKLPNAKTLWEMKVSRREDCTGEMDPEQLVLCNAFQTGHSYAHFKTVWIHSERERESESINQVSVQPRSIVVASSWWLADIKYHFATLRSRSLFPSPSSSQQKTSNTIKGEREQLLCRKKMRRMSHHQWSILQPPKLLLVICCPATDDVQPTILSLCPFVPAILPFGWRQHWSQSCARHTLSQWWHYISENSNHCPIITGSLQCKERRVREGNGEVSNGRKWSNPKNEHRKRERTRPWHVGLALKLLNYGAGALACSG